MMYLHIITYLCTVLFFVIVFNATTLDPKKQLRKLQKEKEALADKKMSLASGKGHIIKRFDYVGPVCIQALNERNAKEKYAQFVEEQQTIVKKIQIKNTENPHEKMHMPTKKGDPGL